MEHIPTARRWCGRFESGLGIASWAAPGLQDLWQLHFSEEGGAAHNVAAEFIVNPDGPDAANDLELTAHPDGSFEVFNSRTQKSKNYPAR